MNGRMLLFASAFVAGAAAGFLAGRAVYEARYAKLAEEEIESVRRRFSERRRPAPNRYEEAKRNHGLAAKQEGESGGKAPARAEPYLIDEAEFSEGYLHHDKEALYYYRSDGVVCDDADEPVDDGAIGADALDFLERNGSCWVRNERLSADYEILAVDGSHAEATGGGGHDDGEE